MRPNLSPYILTVACNCFQTAKPDSQYRLRCQLAASAAAGAADSPNAATVIGNGDVAASRKVHPELARAQTLDNIAKKVSSLTSAVEDLHSQIASMRIFVFVLIALVFATLFSGEFEKPRSARFLHASYISFLFLWS